MTPFAIQLVDLGFGDAGKGAMVDYLVRRHEADLVVRFNGGPQAGHNVVLPDGRHHTFAQFGAGKFVPGVRTLLSRFVLIDPYAMLNEAAHLADVGVPDAMQRTFIDARCLVITPPQQIANRIRERARGADAHGTCGMGVGECVSDDLNHPSLSLFARDLADRSLVRRKLRDMLEHKRGALMPLLSRALPDELRLLNDPSWIEIAVDACGTIASRANVIDSGDAEATIRRARVSIFEGAQGVLLDERYGFAPHTTWSTTTFANADVLLEVAKSPARRHRIGVIRTYMIRHGPGPFPTHRPSMDADLPEQHNLDSGYQGPVRRGVLDFVLLRYALRVCGGADVLAMTHCDQLHRIPDEVCDAYDIEGMRIPTLTPALAANLAQCDAPTLVTSRVRRDPHAVAASVGERLSAPVGFLSDAPTHRHKQAI